MRTFSDQASPVTMGRRDALTMLGVGAATLGGLSALAYAQQNQNQNRNQPSRDPHANNEHVGFDTRSGKYVLPQLPYPAEALEPHIDAETMKLHHDKHHAKYVENLNAAIGRLAQIREGERREALGYWLHELAFNGSGHFLHTIFWNCMSPQGGSSPSGALAEQIEKDFGSFENFADHFRQAANTVKGDGWGLLVYEPIADRLLLLQVEEHHNNTIWGVVPLFGVDVWEHAYYLKYKNDRPAYIDAFMHVANWDFVARRLEGTRRMFAHPQQ